MNILELFEKSKQSLRYPKLVVPYKRPDFVDTRVNQTFQFRESVIQFTPVSNPQDKVIWVSNGKKKSDPDNKLYGYITNKPSFAPFKQNLTPHLAETIVAICKDPVAYAKLQGQQYSFCCFCGTEITSKSSLAVGYGPICAENWGLPWGEVTEESGTENL